MVQNPADTETRANLNNPSVPRHHRARRGLVGAWAASQPLIARGERSGLQMRTATMESFIVHADELLTAFLELERVTRKSLRFPNAEQFGTTRPCSLFAHFPLVTGKNRLQDAVL